MSSTQRQMVMIWRRTSAAELDRLESDPDSAALLVADSPAEELVDVGRAWHAVHVLLTGSAWGGTPSSTGPAYDAVLGGTPLGDPSTYEPVRLLLPDQVQAVSALLGDVGPDDVRARFDAAAFREAEVYPDVWDRPDVLSAFVLPAYEALRRLYGAAAAAGDVVLVQLV